MFTKFSGHYSAQTCKTCTHNIQTKPSSPSASRRLLTKRFFGYFMSRGISLALQLNFEMKCLLIVLPTFLTFITSPRFHCRHDCIVSVCNLFVAPLPVYLITERERTTCKRNRLSTRCVTCLSTNHKMRTRWQFVVLLLFTFGVGGVSGFLLL